MIPDEPKGPSGHDMPKLVPDRDDIALRKKSASTERAKPSPAAVEKDETGSAGIPGWMTTLVVLLVLAVAGLGVMSFQLSQQLNAVSKQMDGRLLSLEGQLSATDESLAMNEDAISAKMTNIMSEIRKLWDVSNKRNKGWIQDNTKDIGAVKQTVTANQSTLTAVQAGNDKALAAAESAATNVNEINTLMIATDSKVNGLSTDQVALKAQVDEVALSLQLLSDQIASSDLATQVSQLQTGYGTTREDIEAINSNRIQVSQRLTSLQKQIQSLEDRISALSPSAPAQ
jgi:chromosome segregation ATPase